MATITRGVLSDIAVLPDYVEHAAPRATRQQVSRWLTYSLTLVLVVVLILVL